MSSVFGNINLVISTNVESNNEELGVLQANYKLNPERFIAYELIGIDSMGEREIITVHDCENVSLVDFIE